MEASVKEKAGTIMHPLAIAQSCIPVKHNTKRKKKKEARCHPIIPLPFLSLRPWLPPINIYTFIFGAFLKALLRAQQWSLAFLYPYFAGANFSALSPLNLPSDHCHQLCHVPFPRLFNHEACWWCLRIHPPVHSLVNFFLVFL